jgi:hypothetical protein
MQHNVKVYAPLAIAGLALAISIVTAVRGAGGAPAGGSGACVDPEAREQLEKLRRALAERDVLLARLARAPGGSGGSGGAGGAASGEAGSGGEAPQPGAAGSDAAARRFVRFVIPNPAVSVTQKEDGSYEIRTTDPSLVGSVLQVTGVTQSGEEQTLLIRIPQ